MNGARGTRAAALLALLAGSIFGLHRIVDPDLFQQVAVGRYLLAHPTQVGRSPFHDLHPDHAYVEDKPLSSVLVALVDRAGGENGLALYQLLLPAVVAGVWFALLRGAGTDPWTSLLGVALALAAAAYRLEPRPDTWSQALLAGTAVLLLRASPGRLVWMLPLLFAVWVNLHGYWVAGFVVIGCAIVAAALGSPPGPIGSGSRAALRLLGIAGLALLACCLHPQGWRAVWWPLEQLRVLRENPVLRSAIVEFSPSTALLAGAGAGHAWLALAFPLLGLAGAIGRRPWSPLQRALAGALGALVWLLLVPQGLAPWPYRLTSALVLAAALEIPFALRGRRWFPVLALAVAVAMALPMVRNLTLLPPLTLWLLAPVWSDALGPQRRRTAVLACGVLALVAGARMADRLPPGTARAPGWTGWGIARNVVPLEAAAHLRTWPTEGRILNDFQSGGVLLASLPGRRVFIAGNTSFYPVEHLVLYREQILTGRIDVEELPRRFGIRTVLLEHAALETPGLLAALARSPAWKPTYLDEAAVVYRHGMAADPPLDLARAAAVAISRTSSRSPLPRLLLPARRLFPALNLGIFLRASGRPDLALGLGERLWEEGPALPIATFHAAAAEEAGRLADAVPFLEDAVRALPPSEEIDSRLARALFFRALASAERGETGAAERDLTRATALRPAEPGPWLALARLAALRGESDLARDRLAHALTLPGAERTRDAVERDAVLRGLR